MEFFVTREVGTLSILTHFEIFIIKICMKVPGIWHKKTWNLGPKSLRKPGILYLEKKWEPCDPMQYSIQHLKIR